MRELYGHNLSETKRKGEYLLVVQEVQMFEKLQNVTYVYAGPVSEETPKTLEELFTTGVYFRNILYFFP